MPTKNRRSLEESSPNYEADWSDKVEPYAASLGLAGDAVGIGAGLTGVGVPVGAAIAGFANVPNLIIDGYQTVRDAYRSYKDNGASLNSALWNGGELILDAAGLKILSSINKAKRAGVAAEQVYSNIERKAAKPYGRVGTGVGHRIANATRKRKSLYNASRAEALKESTEYLGKRGVRAAQGTYFERKLADEMAKRGYGVAVNDAIKSAERVARQNLTTISGVSGGTNTYHITKMKDGGSIHIAPSKRGTFTAAATKHGMGVQEFASRVLRNKDNYSPAMVKKANFARNASKWNH